MIKLIVDINKEVEKKNKRQDSIKQKRQQWNIFMNRINTNKLDLRTENSSNDDLSEWYCEDWDLERRYMNDGNHNLLQKMSNLKSVVKKDIL